MKTHLFIVTFFIIFLNTRILSATEPLYVNGERIPEYLAQIARDLLGVNKETIAVQLEPTLFEKLKEVLNEYKILLTSQTAAINKQQWLELQKTKILP